MNEYENDFNKMNSDNNSYENGNEYSGNEYTSNTSEDDLSYGENLSDNTYSVYDNGTNYEETKSDSDYINPISETENNGDFYNATVRPKKKKRYVSVPAAIIALVLTAVLSIAGGAAVSNTSLFSAKTSDSSSSPSGKKVTVNDDINNSSSVKGTKAKVNTLTGEALTTPEIVDKVGPAVVGIINKTTYGNAYGYYGSLYGNLNDEVEQSSGSGVIISSDGYIVTNNHVVESATKLSVVLSSGEEYEGKIIGTDASTDLAVVKIEASGLTYAQMGSSSELRVGETAIAIGNPLGQEFAGTTTQGIISGLNRSVTIDNKTMNLIQTDAAINPGNSGGALVNEYGMLIGINTAKISSDTLEGLGFAIPIDEAKPIVQELMTNGYVTGRPVIGLAGRAVTKQDAQAYNMKVGVYVSSLTANGPAYMAGIKVGDVIVECEGEPVETVDDINAIKNKKSPGDQLKMKVYRKGNYVDVTVVLGEEMPSSNN